jgi:hypothetical protein
MDRMKETLYDILGVPRNAKINEIERVYARHRSEMRRETAPPDPRRATLLREAFEVLSDPQKREAYDASLRRERAKLLRDRRLGPGEIAAISVVVAIGVIVALSVFRSAEDRRSKLLAEIRTEASLAVGRLQGVGIGGETVSSAVAFTLEQGVMVTPCAGVSPNAQLVVIVPTRRIPARVIGTDSTRRFCRLEVAGGGSWPLKVGGGVPRPGAKVYAPDVAANGEVLLREGSIKGVTSGAQGTIVETSLAVPPDAAGRPLLDADGLVIAVAMVDAGGKGHHIRVPDEWVETGRVKPKPAKPAEPVEPAPGTPAAVGVDGEPSRGPAAISPERRERLEKAFRPPPTVPDDL